VYYRHEHNCSVRWLFRVDKKEERKRKEKGIHGHSIVGHVPSAYEGY